MGIFAQQLKKRQESDEHIFEMSMSELSNVVTAKPVASFAGDGMDSGSTQAAFEKIFRFLKIPIPDIPDDIINQSERLDAMLRPSGVMKRRVELTGKWWTDSIGALLGVKKTGEVVAILPKGRRYYFDDPATGKTVRVNSATAKELTCDAYCFYKPFPQKKLTLIDLVKFIAMTLSASDYILIALTQLMFTVIGMVTPYATNMLFDNVIPLGHTMTLVPMAVMLVCNAIAGSLFMANDMIFSASIDSKIDLKVNSAAMARLLSLPVDFFRKYSSGEMSARLETISQVCEKLREIVLTWSMSAVFSVGYIYQMGQFAPSLVWPGFILIFVNLAFSLLLAYMQVAYERERMKSSAKLRGVLFALLSGIQKIKLAGAEKRMFSIWAKRYGKQAQLQYRPPAVIRLSAIINRAISFGGLIVLYYAAIESNVSVGSYMAFTAAYSMASSTILKLARVVDSVAEIVPSLEMIQPIMDTAPETADNLRVVNRLSGKIEVDHVSFGYNPDQPPVIDDLSFTVKPNEYVAIVGKTGCGKSTLMRLLLGFEKPLKGAISYDDKNLASLDVRSVRRNIGVVLQEGKLFAGDIFSNIAVSAPWITSREAMEAAEMAGIKDDIEKMPMKLRTLISEGGQSISGGQRQRLMIARAIAPKPRILIFDEATSALDNITQKQVADSLAKLRCTRIVIAHRLSTIKNCDRIMLLDSGRIAEEGTFDELVAKDGLFAQLVKRQMV
ncbi:MAG: NHLP bacteriocin export ABC transporter permease/ATPase subunit [Clostridia bacterium]|nr:NHLP bacteriocin export ABC transporter permease/ATPase subunit [Clostridia bacterium]